MTLPAPLAPLGAYRQFIRYTLVPNAKTGKMDKVPTDWRTGYGCKVTEPSAWGSYDECASSPHGHGVGFVFMPTDPFFFFDIDGGLTPEGQWSATAAAIYHALPGAAVEVSQSGTGLHIIGTGSLPDGHRCKNIPEHLELYTTERFAALTMRCYEGGSAATPLGPQIAGQYERWFATQGAAAAPTDWTNEPVPEWAGPVDDVALLEMARASGGAAAAFGGGVTFVDLWDANEDALAARWPNPTGGGYDASSVDMALASHLAFWTGKDCERIERLMRQSALVRDKWDRASGYLEPTITRACGLVSKVLQQKSMLIAPEATAALTAEPDAPIGLYVAPSQFPQYFAGCVYVLAEDRVWSPRHSMLSPSKFDTVYGGRKFIMDAVGQKTTASAWEAFRLNQMWRPPIADVLCFRPESPAGSLIEDEGLALLNTYVPIPTLRIAGDATPFVEYLAKLLPVERDRKILLSYMAALIQNPGRKFQWWPVLQGVQGNGKTMLLSCLSHAVGHRYTHLVNPDAMAKTGGQFNSWIQGHLFVGVEEIYVSKRRDFLEAFKSTVTNSRIAMEGKGTTQTTGDNRANGILLTNHKDGVPISDKDRRYSILWTAQQQVSDLERDGMGGSYFPDLYDWLNGRGKHAFLGTNYGFAVVADYLANYTPDPLFNPAGLCQRAPETSSTKEALVESMGNAEQHVVEAIEEGRVGFAGGWVSSHYLDELLEHCRIHVPLSKRGELMRTLGYVTHPALGEGGRVNNSVLPDRKKPRLYLKTGHLALNLQTGKLVAEAYTDAQGSTGATAAFG